MVNEFVGSILLDERTPSRGVCMFVSFYEERKRRSANVALWFDIHCVSDVRLFFTKERATSFQRVSNKAIQRRIRIKYKLTLLFADHRNEVPILL